MSLVQHGPSKKIVQAAVRLSWPIMIAAKKWSSLPGQSRQLANVWGEETGT